jgi:two-component system, OmpR family, response regulator
MNNGKEVKLFLVDDDAVYLKMLEIEFLRHANFNIESFSTGEQCINNMPHKPDIIVLDYRLDGIDKNAMNGIDTLDKIREIDPEVPVIILSAQDKIEVAIDCMHHGALDYVVKSETAFLRLKKIITSVFRFKKMEKELNWYMERM